MKLLGIDWRLPRYREFTAASIMAIGLWTLGIALTQLAGLAIGGAEGLALLVILWWSCLAVRCGIDLAGGGWRHWTAHGSVALALLLVADGAWAMFGG